MTPNRPYLVRALYEWIIDNNLTPYMLVDASDETVAVPRAFVDENRIILNVSPEATQSLVLGNEAVMFNARFGGRAMEVNVPIGAVLAVYAKENGRGMVFGAQDGEGSAPASVAAAESPDLQQDNDDQPEPPSPPKGPGGRPNLKIVK